MWHEDDCDEELDRPNSPLLPPDDRLWRHPSELSEKPTVPATRSAEVGPHAANRAARKTGTGGVGRIGGVVLAGIALVAAAAWFGPGVSSSSTASNTADDRRSATSMARSAAGPSAAAPAAPEGVTAEPAPPRARMNIEVTDDPAGGALVVEVDPTGSAAEAGIESGDSIIAVDRLRVPDATGLVILLGQRSPGDEVTVEIRRDTGASRTLLPTDRGDASDDSSVPEVAEVVVSLAGDDADG